MCVFFSDLCRVPFLDLEGQVVFDLVKGLLKQGCLHYTPEHCLVNGGVQLYFGVEKAMFQMVAKGIFFKEPCETTRFQDDRSF